MADMILLIAGNGGFAGEPPPSMFGPSPLNYTLQRLRARISPAVKVFTMDWNTSLADQWIWDDIDTVLVCAHSFGVNRAVLIARMLGGYEDPAESLPIEFHLRLFDGVLFTGEPDPVKIFNLNSDPLIQLVDHDPFTLTPNVQSATMYLRDAGGFPVHDTLAIDDGKNFRNIVVPNTDHNSIVAAKTDEFVDQAVAMFGGISTTDGASVLGA